MPATLPLEAPKTPDRRSRSVARTRRGRGATAIEIATTAILMIIMAGFALDVMLLMLALSTNDSACRDACRAAANQSSSARAISAAQSMLKIHATDGFFVSQPILFSTSAPGFVYQDYAGRPPSAMSPYVTVTTQVTAKMPLPLNFFGVKMNGNNSFVFRRQYTFPIVKTTLML